MAKRAIDQFDSSKAGIGYITSDADGREIFFKVRSSVDGGPVFQAGQAVTYEVEEGPDGRLYAINIEVVE